MGREMGSEVGWWDEVVEGIRFAPKGANHVNMNGDFPKGMIKAWTIGE